MSKHQFISLTIWYSLLFWIAILMPLEFMPAEHLTESIPQQWKRLALGGFNLGDAISHATLFMPFGLLLSHIRYYHSATHFKIGLFLVIVLGVISELMQLLVELRSCSMNDLSMDYLGLLLGLVAGNSWHQKPALRYAIDRFFSEKGILTGAVLLILLCSYCFMPVSSGFANWQADFPLLMGNEQDVKRNWNGDIYAVALFDRVLNETEANNLSAGTITAKSLQPLLQYDFSPATLQVKNNQVVSITDTGGHFPQAALWAQGRKKESAVDEVMAIKGGGIRLQKGGWLRASQLPDSIYQRLITSNRLSLFVRFRAASKLDTGPARIVSLSNGAYDRNFTLGQSMGRLSFRVRTPFTGNNGSWPELMAKNCITPLETQSTVSIFSGTSSRIYVNGSLCGTQIFDRLNHLGPAYLVVPRNSAGALAMLFVGWSIFAMIYLAAFRRRSVNGSLKLLGAGSLAAVTIAGLGFMRYLLQ